MRNIESFDNEHELLGRIEQLKIDGIQEESITVVTKEAFEKSSLEYTGVEVKSSEGTAWDKIVSFFSSEDPESRVVSSLELSEKEEQKYKSELDKGKILLCVDDGEPNAAAKDKENNKQTDGTSTEDEISQDIPQKNSGADTQPAGIIARDDAAGRTSDKEATQGNVDEGRQDTLQPDEQSVDGASNGAAGAVDGAGSTAQEDSARESIPSGEYDDPDESSPNQIHNPADEEGVSLDKTHEAHDHSEKLKEDDSHLAYGEGTDEHIAVDPSVETDTEESDAEKIEKHEDPEYLKGDQNEYDYGNKETVINEYKMDDRRHQHLTNTHNHPELAEEVSTEEKTQAEEKKRQPIDKNTENKNRDYSYKNDVNGEQVIRLDEENR